MGLDADSKHVRTVYRRRGISTDWHKENLPDAALDYNRRVLDAPPTHAHWPSCSDVADAHFAIYSWFLLCALSSGGFSGDFLHIHRRLRGPPPRHHRFS